MNQESGATKLAEKSILIRYCYIIVRIVQRRVQYVGQDIPTKKVVFTDHAQSRYERNTPTLGARTHAARPESLHRNPRQRRKAFD